MLAALFFFFPEQPDGELHRGLLDDLARQVGSFFYFFFDFADAPQIGLRFGGDKAKILPDLLAIFLDVCFFAESLDSEFRSFLCHALHASCL
jgi:hypothetical protein